MRPETVVTKSATNIMKNFQMVLQQAIYLAWIFMHTVGHDQSSQKILILSCHTACVTCTNALRSGYLSLTL